MTKILVLEDDIKLSAELKLFLANKGFECRIALNGEAFKELNLIDFDLYLLDINVPHFNGIEACNHIRKTNTMSPILMLTAYGAVGHKLNAFDAGADDYLVKPFHLEELHARVKALLRRTHQEPNEKDEIFLVGDLEINISTMRVTRGTQEIILTPKEYKLLELLARAEGRTVSKQTIAEKVWDLNFETGTNTIEVYINFLRAKIDKGYNSKLIHTRPGFGYYLKFT